jgi:hypothetical protein
MEETPKRTFFLIQQQAFPNDSNRAGHVSGKS